MNMEEKYNRHKREVEFAIGLAVEHLEEFVSETTEEEALALLKMYVLKAI